MTAADLAANFPAHADLIARLEREGMPPAAILAAVVAVIERQAQAGLLPVTEG